MVQEKENEQTEDAEDAKKQSQKAKEQTDNPFLSVNKPTIINNTRKLIQRNIIPQTLLHLQNQKDSLKSTPQTIRNPNHQQATPPNYV